MCIFDFLDKQLRTVFTRVEVFGFKWFETLKQNVIFQNLPEVIRSVRKVSIPDLKDFFEGGFWCLSGEICD